jgi:glycosyltransferase involved in cell wall biosynthesis
MVITEYGMQLDPRFYRQVPLILGARYLVDDNAHRPGPLYLISPPVDLAHDAASAGAAEAFLSAFDLTPAHIRVLIVSRLASLMKARGIEIAIDAMASFGDADVDLVIVGGGDAEPKLRARGAAHNARVGRQQVTFVGEMDDPRPAYACADIVIGMGGSAARALAFGKPLIAIGDNGFSATVTPERAESLFRFSFWSAAEPTSPTDLMTQHLVPLIGDPSLREQLSEFGAAFAREHFGLDAMADRLRAVYDEVLSAWRQPMRWLADAAQSEVPWVARSVGRRASGVRSAVPSRNCRTCPLGATA